eukprot:6434-Heterococcus_DN1.PRE.1
MGPGWRYCAAGARKSVFPVAVAYYERRRSRQIFEDAINAITNYLYCSHVLLSLLSVTAAWSCENCAVAHTLEHSQQDKSKHCQYLELQHII